MSHCRWPVLLPALALAVSGCTVLGGGDDADSDDAEDALLAQRDAVEQTAQGLVAASEDVLGTEVLAVQGGWEGCTSRFPEGYEDFRYTADVRLDARAGAPEDLGAELRTIAGTSGYDVGAAGSGAPDDPVVVTDDAVEASLLDVPDAGAEGDVLIRLVAGPCVAVPEDQWSDWMSRTDPGPRV